LQLREEEKLMRTLKVNKIWIPAFLLAVALAGCGDPDKNPNASNAGDPLTPPTVTFVTPPNGNVGVCPNANPVVITAVFRKAIYPATINTSTFTLSGPGGASVTGAVTYVVSTNTATFTPSVALSASNLQVMVLANNRRVDVSLNTTGQQSTRLYPFNAKDFLALISTKGGEKKPPVKKTPRR
jgi:Big-like domain-containing protein